MIHGGAAALSAFVSSGDLTSNVWREMLDALPAAIYLTDQEGRLTYYNPAAVRLSGRRPELGTDKWCVTWKIFEADGSPLPHDQCPMARVLRGDQVPAGIECLAERPDGSRFWFTPAPAALRDAQGRIIGAVNLLVDITARKTSEAEAQEQFRAIVETTPECVKIVAADGALVFMNAPGLDILEAPSAEALVGKSIYDVIAPEDRERYRNFNERICAGEKGSLAFDIVGMEGTRRHMETRAAPLRHLGGATMQLAITRDVTERTRDERARLLLGAIVDSSDDAIISKDLNGIITSWNQAAERVFGYTAEEAVGRSITMLIPHDRLDEEPKILSRLRRGDRVDHFETVRRRKNGDLIDISLTISPVKDAQGRIVGASKIARDISDRKRAELAIVESEARFRQLADSMPQLVWTARPDGSIDYYNERWYEFAGLPGAPSTELSKWESMLHADDLATTRESYYAAIRSGEPFNRECRLWAERENRWRWFVGRAVPVRGPNGNILKWIGSWTDIDEQKRVQDDLRRANEDLEQFAYSASHDLQEPLRSVKIYSELLGRRYGDKLDGDALTFLGYLRGGATRMEALVRDLLTYTQATQFQQPEQEADANVALEAALCNLASAIAEARGEVSVAPLPSVAVHAMHLQQLFQNLISNAIKYHRPDRAPAVRVTAGRDDGYWKFSVSDNGIGIEPQYKESIFGLFKRLHSGDEYSGTGIGLAICQRIVDRYRGRIWVESQPGSGSTFHFTIPVSREAGKHPAAGADRGGQSV